MAIIWEHISTKLVGEVEESAALSGEAVENIILSGEAVETITPILMGEAVETVTPALVGEVVEVVYIEGSFEYLLDPTPPGELAYLDFSFSLHSQYLGVI